MPVLQADGIPRQHRCRGQVARIGTSSVRYAIGIFRNDDETRPRKGTSSTSTLIVPAIDQSLACPKPCERCCSRCCSAVPEGSQQMPCGRSRTRRATWLLAVRANPARQIRRASLALWDGSDRPTRSSEALEVSASQAATLDCPILRCCVLPLSYPTAWCGQGHPSII